MPRRLRWPLLYVCLLLGLAGCTISTYSGVTTSPCAAQTAAAATATPTSNLGTRTNGPLVITTDRTVYGPLDEVHVTITNYVQATSAAQSNLDTQVYVVLTPPGPGCPGAQVEHLQGNVWQEVRVCFPGGGVDVNPGTGEITVPPDKTYEALIVAHTDRSRPDQQDPFPAGLYRLAVHYYILASPGAIIRYGRGGGFIAYSQPFRVCTCGVCA